ncbi:hypothetical protein AB4Z40_08680 [Bosea sp. 2YAB26]|uniref:hypothetical protein n=1 Tax=Bosea sp. 2YAB26 TaxID=3237478 RepID=UPI003F91A4E9
MNAPTLSALAVLVALAGAIVTSMGGASERDDVFGRNSATGAFLVVGALVLAFLAGRASL